MGSKISLGCRDFPENKFKGASKSSYLKTEGGRSLIGC